MRSCGLISVACSIHFYLSEDICGLDGVALYGKKRPNPMLGVLVETETQSLVRRVRSAAQIRK